VFLNVKRGQAAVEHSGAIPGFSAQLICFPDRRVTLAILANMDAAFGDIEALERAVLDVALPG